MAVSQNRTEASQSKATRRVALTTRSEGFTFLEIMVVMALLMMLVIAAISAVTLLDRTSRRQAHHTTAMEVAQGKLDEFLAIPYLYPDPPFTSSNYVQNQSMTLTVNRNGTAVSTAASVTSMVEPVLNGHVVTVVVSYTNYNQPTSVRLQTLVNELSGGQP